MQSTGSVHISGYSFVNGTAMILLCDTIYLLSVFILISTYPMHRVLHCVHCAS